ncbi:MAG: site-2 protease family protein [Patescibacteria group bacterium]
MPISTLFSNPLFFIAWIAAILLTLALHEFAHAYVAHRLGDDTARDAGRLTLNPLAHVDLLGLFMLVLIGFGWGKPVPVNQYDLKYKKWGNALVSLAGPAANLIGILFFGAVLKMILMFTSLSPANLLVQFVNILIIINIILMIFNLIPIPPLDGSKLLFTVLENPKYDRIKMRLQVQGPLILIGLILLDSLFGLGFFSSLFRGIINLVYRVF